MNPREARFMLRSLFVTLCIVTVFALLTISCSGTTATPDPPAAITAAVEVPGSADTTVPLSFLIKQSQQRFVTEGLAPWFTACTNYPEAPLDGPQKAIGGWTGNHWTRDNMVFSTAGGEISVTWTYDGMDPLASTWTYGDTKNVVPEHVDDVGGSAYLLDNSANETVLEFSQDETVTLHQERSTSTSTEISVDIGTKTTGSIGGDAEGAKIEEEVSANYGIKTDRETAESESKDTTKTRHLATTVEPKHATLATIETTNLMTETPFTINGIWLGSFVLRMQIGEIGDGGGVNTGGKCGAHITHDSHVASRSGDYYSTTWASVDDWLDMVACKNVDFPVCPNDTWNSALALKGHAYIDKTYNRAIVTEGIQKRTYQDGAEVKFADVTGQNLNDVIKDHGVDPTHVVTASSPGLGAPPVEALQIVVTEDAIYLLTTQGVTKYDAIGERDPDFNIPIGDTPWPFQSHPSRTAPTTPAR